MIESGLPLPATRCLTREQAADYLGIGVTLFTELGIPCVKFGRRCVYDRIDLDAWLDDYKQRGRAGKETLWLEKLECSKDQIHGSIGLTLPSPNGKRLRQSAGTEHREEAEAYLAKLTLDAYRQAHFGIKPERSWQDAVVRYLELKASLRSFRDVQRICRQLHGYVGHLTLNQINGDVVWLIAQSELKRGNKPATVNRYLSLIRNLLHLARDEWQWIDNSPKFACCMVRSPATVG